MSVSSRSALIVIGFLLIMSSTFVKADVVAVVSAKSPINALSKSQVADIFLGKSNRLPNGIQALPIDQAEGLAVRDEFYDKLLGRTAAQMKSYWSKLIFTGRGQPPPSVSGDIEMKKRIGDNKAAIGYIERSLVDDSVKIVF